MRRILGPVVLVGALASAAVAQAPPPAPAPAPDHAAEWEALEAAYEAAGAAFWKAYQAAKSDAERAKLVSDPAHMPEAEFAPRIRAFADRAKGSDPGLQALLWLLENDDPENETGTVPLALVRQILAAHAGSPRLTALAEWLVWGASSLPAGEGERALLVMREKSPHRTVQAAAIFALAQVLAGGEEKAQALRLLETLQKDFADTDHATQAKGLHFELTRLQIGMVAPDFEATDAAGKAFKLSDYRGKVVVIDFWGYW